MVTHSLSADVIGPSDRGTVPVATAAVHQTCATAVTAPTFSDRLHVRSTATPHQATDSENHEPGVFGMTHSTAHTPIDRRVFPQGGGGVQNANRCMASVERR